MTHTTEAANVGRYIARLDPAMFAAIKRAWMNDEPLPVGMISDTHHLDGQCRAHGDYDCTEPECRGCEGCLADPGEPCRPGCLPAEADCEHGNNDGGPCPTCDHCGKSQCEDDSEWNGETGCHVHCEVDAEPDWSDEHLMTGPDLSRIGGSVKASCNHRDDATCLRCGLDWCFECDPGPAASCPVCHGRGYSTATWSLPNGAVWVAGTAKAWQ